MQEVRGSTLGREFFSPYLGRFVLLRFFFQLFFYLFIEMLFTASRGVALNIFLYFRTRHEKGIIG